MEITMEISMETMVNHVDLHGSSWTTPWRPMSMLTDDNTMETKANHGDSPWFHGFHVYSTMTRNMYSIVQ